MLFAVLLLAVVSARAEGFRFALMSDLHVTADSLAANDLRHAVDQINATPGLSFVFRAISPITETMPRCGKPKRSSTG